MSRTFGQLIGPRSYRNLGAACKHLFGDRLSWSRCVGGYSTWWTLSFTALRGCGLAECVMAHVWGLLRWPFTAYIIVHVNFEHYYVLSVASDIRGAIFIACSRPTCIARCVFSLWVVSVLTRACLSSMPRSFFSQHGGCGHSWYRPFNLCKNGRGLTPRLFLPLLNAHRGAIFNSGEFFFVRSQYINAAQAQSSELLMATPKFVISCCHVRCFSPVILISSIFDLISRLFGLRISSPEALRYIPPSKWF